MYSKLFYLIVPVIFLSSCKSKNWNITPDNFIIKNPTQIDYKVKHNELTVIEDIEFLKYFYKEINDNWNKEDIEYQIENYPSYFYSWHNVKTRDFKEFTIVTNGQWESAIYYVIMNNKGKIISTSVTASNNFYNASQHWCVTKFKDESNFEKYNYDLELETLFPIEKVTKCNIDKNGSIKCESTVALIPAVCLWDKLSIRATPEEKGKYITSTTLGEKIYDLEESKTDENSSDKIEFRKVRLSDGTEGWIQNKFIASKAYAAVITEESFIYKRQDELTKTDTRFEAMDIVALLESPEETGWYKIKGKPAQEKWFKEGWVKEGVSTSKINISVAYMIKEASKENDLNKRNKKLQEILDNPTFKYSIFIDDIKKILELD